MSTVTNTALLMGLRTEDRAAWDEFIDRYRPLLINFARRLGLGESDAQDATQDALLAFADAYRQGKYERDRGRLRSWLFAIATRKIRDVQRHRGRGPHVVEPQEKTQILQHVADDDTISQVWEAEWRRAMTDACIAEVRRHVEPTTFEAFSLFVLQEWPAEDVAGHLGISRNAVFKAKRRVLSRMRDVYRRLQSNW